MSEVGGLVDESLTMYETLSLPMIAVLGDEFAKLTDNLGVLETNLESTDLDAIIFENRLTLELNPTQLVSKDKRVQASETRSKSLRYGIQHLTTDIHR